jgi:two-component system chemotaxis sensor kinase CheA
MPFGIFEDDDIDDKNIGFYDDELENISNNTDANKFKIDENKENFGFFDGMEKISPNSVMETNRY